MTKKNEILFLDEHLIQQVGELSNGLHVHKIANMIAAYQASFEFASSTKTPEDVELFREAEADLRIFVAQRKEENFDPDTCDDLKF